MRTVQTNTPARLLLVALIIFPGFTGCARHVSTLTPAQNFTLSAKQTLALVADSNKAAQDAAIGIQSAGLMPVGVAREVVTYTVEVARIIQKANAAVDQGTTVEQRTQAVLDALNQITQLPPGVQAFIGSPGTTGQVASLINLLKQTIQLARALSAPKGN